TRWTLRERSQQIAAETEDLLRVAIDQLAHFGCNESATRFLEQLLAQASLQGLQLRTDGWRGEVQHRGRLRDAAFAHDRPEVKKMLVVEPADVGHDPCTFWKLSVD